jgi:hypothetical protein
VLGAAALGVARVAPVAEKNVHVCPGVVSRSLLVPAAADAPSTPGRRPCPSTR